MRRPLVPPHTKTRGDEGQRHGVERARLVKKEGRCCAPQNYTQKEGQGGMYTWTFTENNILERNKARTRYLKMRKRYNGRSPGWKNSLNKQTDMREKARKTRRVMKRSALYVGQEKKGERK